MVRAVRVASRGRAVRATSPVRSASGRTVVRVASCGPRRPGNRSCPPSIRVPPWSHRPRSSTPVRWEGVLWLCTFTSVDSVCCNFHGAVCEGIGRSPFAFTSVNSVCCNFHWGRYLPRQSCHLFFFIAPRGGESRQLLSLTVHVGPRPASPRLVTIVSPFQPTHLFPPQVAGNPSSVGVTFSRAQDPCHGKGPVARQRTRRTSREERKKVSDRYSSDHIYDLTILTCTRHSVVWRYLPPAQVIRSETSIDALLPSDMARLATASWLDRDMRQEFRHQTVATSGLVKGRPGEYLHSA